MSGKIKLAMLIVVVGLGVAAYQVFIFMSESLPKLEQERAAQEAQLIAKQTELKKLQEFSQNIEGIKQELKELNLQLESALEHMPRNFNLSGLLRKFTMLAQNSGIELSTFKPAKKEEKKEGVFFSTIGVDFDLKGGFTQTLVFLDQLSRLKRIVNVETLKIKSAPGVGSRSGPVQATTLATIRTYRFSE